ncbi:MAG: response regulator transcription factor [Spirochaetes bacterium]|nr:response regulator transcription factor [Spirochaetota bacterium]MBX3723716.1 response regulator transcription factor [Turneriella sp.]
MNSGIVIVDDHAPFRAALRQHLAEHDDFEILAEFSDGHDFLEAPVSEHWHILLLDISMPKIDGITVLGRLGDRHSRLRAIIVSGRLEEVYRRAAFSGGAAGFVTKDLVFSDLVPCIRKVLAGGRWFPGEVW